MSKEKVEKNMHSRRIDKIIFIYHFYLFEYSDSQAIDKAMNTDNWNFNKEDLNFIEKFLTQRKAAEKYVSQFLNDKWTFNRLEPFIKSIIIHSVIEIMNYDIDRSIVINEAVIICKEYSYDSVYPMVNAVLDKIRKK